MTHPAETYLNIAGRNLAASGSIQKMPGVFERVLHNSLFHCGVCNEIGGRISIGSLELTVNNTFQNPTKMHNK